MIRNINGYEDGSFTVKAVLDFQNILCNIRCNVLKTNKELKN